MNSGVNPAITFTLPISNTPAVINLPSMSNANSDGTLVYSVADLILAPGMLTIKCINVIDPSCVSFFKISLLPYIWLLLSVLVKPSALFSIFVVKKWIQLSNVSAKGYNTFAFIFPVIPGSACTVTTNDDVIEDPCAVIPLTALCDASSGTCQCVDGQATSEKGGSCVCAPGYSVCDSQNGCELGEWTLRMS